jgi:hypothetical protein
VKNARRATDHQSHLTSPDDEPSSRATRLSAWRARPRSITRSLPSLAELEGSLIDLRKTNDLYSSAASARLDGLTQQLSRG